MNTTTTSQVFAHSSPGNRRDRARFDAMSDWAQDRVRFAASQLYDGTRTVARCWDLALTAEEMGA